MSAYQEFCRVTGEINDLLCVINLLNWDSRTQMPPGGAATRAMQLATVSRLAQERFAGDEMGRLLDRVEGELAGADPDSYPVRAARAAREAYAAGRRLPGELVARLAGHTATAQRIWEDAKPANNFAAFAPYLAEIVTLNRSVAEAIGYAEHPYDALAGLYEPGMTAARLHDLFAALRAVITPLLERVAAAPPVDASFLQRDFPPEQQRAFALEVAQEFGFDLDRGRVDLSAHPFEISLTRQDVRMTTRFQPHNPLASLFGLLHETGHALYEQGVDPALTRSPLTSDYLGLYAVGGASYGMHESQSRLWENQVGRSRAFWDLHYARLQAAFPGQLDDVSVDTFYRVINRVQPSLIRAEADEVTYNLHIMVRVEIEMALLEGDLAVDDLPDAWNSKMREYLGVIPPNDTLGVLQDIHWAGGQFGAFPTYTIGNVMSGQFMAAARCALPGLDDALAAGDYAPLRTWLAENIHRHGRAFSPEELLVRTTGAGLNPAPYLAYLQEKYSALYP